MESHSGRGDGRGSVRAGVGGHETPGRALGCCNATKRRKALTLYDLSAEIKAILDSDPDGELSDDVLDRLEYLEMDLRERIDYYCRLIEEYEARALVKKKEIGRLNKRKSIDENNVERIKKRIETALKVAGIRTIETDLHLVYMQENNPGCELIADIKDVDKKWLRTKTTTEPNKVEALRHWRETGEVPDGFEIRQSESVRIK